MCLSMMMDYNFLKGELIVYSTAEATQRHYHN